MELTNVKHERFCQEYLIDLNASQAYVRTGYQGKNRGARAAELKALPAIAARIEELIAERAVRTGINTDRVVRELARIGFLDPADILNLNTAAVLDSATVDDRAAIASIKVKIGKNWVEREVRLADKLLALELLGKHLGLFQDILNINGELPKIVNNVPRDGNQ